MSCPSSNLQSSLESVYTHLRLYSWVEGVLFQTQPQCQSTLRMYQSFELKTKYLVDSSLPILREQLFIRFSIFVSLWLQFRQFDLDISLLGDSSYFLGGPSKDCLLGLKSMNVAGQLIQWTSRLGYQFCSMIILLCIFLFLQISLAVGSEIGVVFDKYNYLSMGLSALNWSSQTSAQSFTFGLGQDSGVRFSLGLRVCFVILKEVSFLQNPLPPQMELSLIMSVRLQGFQHSRASCQMSLQTRLAFPESQQCQLLASIYNSFMPKIEYQLNLSLLQIDLNPQLQAYEHLHLDIYYGTARRSLRTFKPYGKQALSISLKIYSLLHAQLQVWLMSGANMVAAGKILCPDNGQLKQQISLNLQMQTMARLKVQMAVSSRCIEKEVKEDRDEDLLVQDKKEESKQEQLQNSHKKQSNETDKAQLKTTALVTITNCQFHDQPFI